MQNSEHSDSAKPSLQHNNEIYLNKANWDKKPVLQLIYSDFYKIIKSKMLLCPFGKNDLEVGSGMGNIKKVMPDCLTSDIFPNPWLDRVENAYMLNFPESALANLIFFDVWHHLRYPANALAEAYRVLIPGGRLIIMDPAMSLTGRFVYGLFHHEPLDFNVKFPPIPVHIANPDELPYFAAQSSASRLLSRCELPQLLHGWNILEQVPMTSFAYLASGGFRGRQLYPDCFLPVLRCADRLLGRFPKLFAARLLVVLEKAQH
jgi:SAM-dependent methyltransferase